MPWNEDANFETWAEKASGQKRHDGLVNILSLLEVEQVHLG